MHSDLGANYMSAEYAKVLDGLRLRPSAGRTGICLENAMVKSFFEILKNERVSRVTYLNRDITRRNITQYIEFCYNRERLHSTCRL